MTNENGIARSRRYIYGNAVQIFLVIGTVSIWATWSKAYWGTRILIFSMLIIPVLICAADLAVYHSRSFLYEIEGDGIWEISGKRRVLVLPWLEARGWIIDGYELVVAGLNGLEVRMDERSFKNAAKVYGVVSDHLGGQITMQQAGIRIWPSLVRDLACFLGVICSSAISYFALLSFGDLEGTFHLPANRLAFAGAGGVSVFWWNLLIANYRVLPFTVYGCMFCSACGWCFYNVQVPRSLLWGSLIVLFAYCISMISLMNQKHLPRSQ